MLLLSSTDFFKINIFKKPFQEHYQNVKLFGSRSGDVMSVIWAVILQQACSCFAMVPQSEATVKPVLRGHSKIDKRS